MKKSHYIRMNKMSVPALPKQLQQEKSIITVQYIHGTKGKKYKRQIIL